MPGSSRIRPSFRRSSCPAITARPSARCASTLRPGTSIAGSTSRAASARPRSRRHWRNTRSASPPFRRASPSCRQRRARCEPPRRRIAGRRSARQQGACGRGVPHENFPLACAPEALTPVLRHVLTPIHPDGWRFIAIAAVVTLIFFWLWTPLGWLGLLVTLWCVYFFRDPWRVTPTRVGMFLNVFDVHINRMPMSGRILKLAYHAGKFLNASLDKASDENERMAIRVATSEGPEIAVVQIAGLVARRIVCNLSAGQDAIAGQRFGLIRFGSRTDVYLPPSWPALVIPGQRVLGGETVIADARAQEPPRRGITH